MKMHPEPSDYIDIHSHTGKFGSGVFGICNYILAHDDITSPCFPRSCGIHPWYIPEGISIETLKDQIMTACSGEVVLAVGECGLDKTAGSPFDLQKEIFIAHVEVSEALSKPLIVHCVKATEILLGIRKHSGSTQPWIFHGFTGNRETALQLISHGIGISIGERMAGNEDRLIPLLAGIPMHNIFLETDEGKMRIEEIYRITASCVGVGIQALKEQLYQNFKQVFC